MVIAVLTIMHVSVFKVLCFNPFQNDMDENLITSWNVIAEPWED